MSGAGTRTRSGQKARAKSAKQDPAAATTGAPGAGRGRAGVRHGPGVAPPRRAGREAADAVAGSRRRRRRGLRVVGMVVVVAGLAVGAALSPILDVESVTVTGVAADRAAAVEDAAGVGVGDPLLGFLPGRAAARVEDLPWVERATVARDLSGSVRIAVVPRVPVGWTTVGARVLVVDADGSVIDTTDVAPSGVPELTGVADVTPARDAIRPRSLATAAGALGPELRMRIASVGLDDGAITAQVVYGPQLRFGVPDRMAVKARVAAAVLASLGDAPVGYVDVSVPAAPVTG